LLVTLACLPSTLCLPERKTLLQFVLQLMHNGGPRRSCSLLHVNHLVLSWHVVPTIVKSACTSCCVSTVQALKLKLPHTTALTIDLTGTSPPDEDGWGLLKGLPSLSSLHVVTDQQRSGLTPGFYPGLQAIKSLRFLVLQIPDWMAPDWVPAQRLGPLVTQLQLMLRQPSGTENP
jgi:hypothetical protein